MSSVERWHTIRAIFQEALELPPDARDGFLAGACGGDEALGREVRSLLAAHGSAAGFLETPAFRPEDVAPGRTAPTLQAGDRVGRYEVTGALGAGGMGEVYRARDLRLDREVAIKILPRTFASDPQRLARFARESRVLASLKHPNIATIYSIEDAEGLPLLVLELVEGPTLAERVKAGPVPPQEALAIARQLADALDAAHERGIVHRDLKPANVKVSPSGRVTLLDFGLAKARAGEDDALTSLANTGVETKAGLILGTCGYMSPEQARGRPVDRRADIWAFGCVVFELLAGRPAFEGETALDTLSAVLERQPDWSRLPPDLPPTIDRLLRRCLEKDPERRLPALADVRLEIEQALQPHDGVAAPDTIMVTPSAGAGIQPSVQAAAAPASVPAARPGWVSASRRRLAVPIAVLSVIAGVGGWYRFGRSEAAIDSLAILPFANRSSDADTEYLGDELAENLIGQMSRVPSLTVMARGTTARFKGAVDPRGVGQSLSVGAVLTGTVSRRGDQFVIAVELIDVPSGARLWGATYDRPGADLLHVQDSIASEIAEGLRLRLSERQKRSLGGQGTTDPRAYELVMRARHLMLSNAEEDDLQARQLFEQATALDPGFVDAHLGIATTYLRSTASGYAPPGEAFQRARVELDRVLALDPDNVRARASKASLLYQRDWNWLAAEREFRALSGDPRLFLGIQYHAPVIFFWAVGRPDESVSILERALEIDPGNLESRIMLCDFLAEAGRLADGVDCYRSVTAAAPTDSRALFGLAQVLRRRADLPGAIETLRLAYQHSGEETGVRLLGAVRTETDYEAAEQAMARARLEDLQALARERYVSPLDLARLYSQTGERESAFAALRQALAERSPMLVLLKVDRAWDGIRDDPRFADCVRQVGIP